MTWVLRIFSLNRSGCFDLELSLNIAWTNFCSSGEYQFWLQERSLVLMCFHIKIFTLRKIYRTLSVVGISRERNVWLLLGMEPVYHGMWWHFNIHKAKGNYRMHHMCVRKFILEFHLFNRHCGFILTMSMTGTKLNKKTHYLLQKLYLRCLFIGCALRFIHFAAFYSIISWYPFCEHKL